MSSDPITATCRECGVTFTYTLKVSRRGRRVCSKACRNSLSSKRFKAASTHGRSRSKEYRAWCHIIDRCENSSDKQFKDYGGRGICMCGEWRTSFEAFLQDMGNAPSDAHQIDRINVNGDYRPGNCRWATQLQQARNTRANRFVEFNGQRLPVSEWSEVTGIAASVLYSRIARGWPAERALTEPSNAKHRPKSKR